MNDNPSFNIFNYNFEQIRNLSDEWHEIMADQGSGKIYGPIKPENIIYRFKNPLGYTIQKITTENDLLVEGNRMNHCVGSYANAVHSGKSAIFSLRDQNNNPLATIELSGDLGSVRQIMANSNSEPSPEIKKLIGEWISTIPNIKWAYNSSSIDDELYELEYTDNLDDELEEILKKVESERDDYGIIHNYDKNIIPFYEKIIKLYEHENKYYRRNQSQYYWNMRETAETIARFAVIFDKIILKYWLSTQQTKMSSLNWQEQSNVNMLNEIKYKNIEELHNDWRDFDWISLPEPERDDFEDEDSYNIAVENHEEEEQKYNDENVSQEMEEYMKENLPYGFDDDISDYIEKYVDQEYTDLVEKVVNHQKS